LAASAIKETGSVVPIDDAFELLSSALSALKDFEELQDSNAALQGQDRNLLSSYIAKLYVEVYNTFGVMYKASGNSQDAIRSFQRALSFNSNDGHALVQLASLDASPLPDDVDCTENASTTTAGTTSLDQDYIVDLFDGYSDRFEDELVSVLQYRGHEWVTNEVLEHIKRRLQKASSDRTTDFDFDGTDDDQAIKFRCTVVDLGCGTGLVGQSLRAALDDPIFDKLDAELRGVDLSPRMVEITRSKEYKALRTYDRVENNDAVKYLSRITACCQSSVDYIVAADVFIYIGDLDELFEVAHQALCDNGVLIFSIEHLLARDDSRGVGLKLLRSGRFGHSQAYIETTANRHGLKLKLWKNGTLRKQRGEDVRGAVVVLEKE
jgi:predicted TPR repeat methyltransferase